jgi:acyl-CoA hydrolase
VQIPIGKIQFSGVGGQMDFIRGASLFEGAKAIIAMSSITKKEFQNYSIFK